MSDYFEEEATHSLFASKYLKDIRFDEHNLVSDTINSDFDMIVCRNVMIYFNQTLQDDVVRLLHGSLVDKGTLVLGSRESLINVSMNKNFLCLNNAERIYQKHRAA